MYQFRFDTLVSEIQVAILWSSLRGNFWLEYVSPYDFVLNFEHMAFLIQVRGTGIQG